MKTSTNELYQKLFKGITSDPNNFVRDEFEASERVLSEKYAYIGGIWQVERIQRQDCSLGFIKDTFFHMKLGFAVAKGWKYKKYFDRV